jgi:signal transduction histidine kinase
MDTPFIPPNPPNASPPLTLVCPQCHAPVGMQDTTCPTCGINLELATAFIEREALAFTPSDSAAPFVAEIILPRFGEYLVQGGYITEAQLAQALARQSELAVQGKTQTIGQILLEMGVITRERLDWASIRQVQELQTALRKANRELQESVAERTQALHTALQKLSELNALKANFVANISHELRTPLSHIMGYGGLLDGGVLGALSDEQREAVTIILQSGARLKTLIDDLIRFAGSMRGDMALQLEDLALEVLAADVVALARSKAEHAQVQLEAEVAADLPAWRADQDKLRWALNQLLDNAVKFTPAGGRVTLAVTCEDGLARLSVTDTGIGIPAEHLPVIFAPFHQLDGSATRRYGGTGLGLAMVKRIVEAHGGRLEVHSQPEQGSQFTICLPGRPSDA